MRDLAGYKEIYACIADAEKNPVPKQVRNVKGFSGAKNLRLIQNIAATVCSPQKAYLEVGVFRGMTLSHTALCLPENSYAYGIDNFSLFDKENKNRSIIQQLLTDNNITNAVLIDEDFEVALKDISKYIPTPVGFYNIDGPHDYRSQMMCLLLAKEMLADDAVIIVDDANYPHVRQANHDFLMSHPEFTLLFETYTEFHPDNQPDITTATNGWWDGVNILVKDPGFVLPRMYPTLSPSKQLFYNDHAVHSHKNSVLAPHILQMWNAFWSFRLKKFLQGFVLMRRERKAYKGPKELFIFSNTGSKDLASKVNPGVL